GQNSGATGIRRDSVEGLALLIILIIGIGEFALRIALLRSLLEQMNQPFRRLIRQGAQQRRVDGRENRRVRADTDWEREYGNQSETGLFQQHSRAVAQVLPERIHSSSRRAGTRFQRVNSTVDCFSETQILTHRIIKRRAIIAAKLNG